MEGNNWIGKYNDSSAFSDEKYIKLGSETDVTLNLVVEPSKRVVPGSDGKDKTYMDLVCVDGKLLSCTGYLFSVICKELDQLKDKQVKEASLRIKKIQGDKVSWVVVLKSAL